MRFSEQILRLFRAAFFTWTLFTALLVACAHDKMSQGDLALKPGLITKATPIYVEGVSAEKTAFAGDQATDAQRISGEKSAIEQLYAKKIVESLRKRGFNVSLASLPKKEGIVLSGRVSRFDHGSAAGRSKAGMGPSNMYSDFLIEDRTVRKTLAKFEVIATSGGRGPVAASSFMDAHFKDGAEKVADYISNAK